MRLPEMIRRRDALLGKAFQLELAERLEEAEDIWQLVKRATDEIDCLRAREEGTG
jgi:hypothetical protein